jgi:hypothetical protein
MGRETKAKKAQRVAAGLLTHQSGWACTAGGVGAGLLLCLAITTSRGLPHTVSVSPGEDSCDLGWSPSDALSVQYPACMFTVVRLLFASLVAFAASRAALAAEILALRHQLAVLVRSSPARVPFTCWDRALWAFLLRHWSGWKDSLALVKPATVVAWHRRAFRLFWRRGSAAGCPATRAEVRRLIRLMAQENATWGAPRIHGELLKLGYVVGERTVSRYLARIRPEPTKPSSQTWTTFLKNHARDIVAVDMFVVPTIRFQVLYVFIILSLERRRLVFANVTAIELTGSPSRPD